jgi:hypothetical protein
MSESLGLSIGMANLVAARAGGDAVTRRSVLTLFDQQASEVGLPAESPGPAEGGLVMRGFVERVGDRTPLVAADGTKYLGDALTVEALEAMARTVDYGTPVTIAVPAYWSPEQSAALREEFFAQPGLAPGGVPPALISDATAALTALRSEPDFPTEGIVALCDFGAGGTTVTLSDAGSGFAQIGPSVRYHDFSGDGIDELILDHLREAIPTDTSGGVASTTRMGSMARLLEHCRRAKEELSTATVTTLPAVTGEEVELSRNEFEGLISGPLDTFVTGIENILQRNEIPTDSLAAVATVGGGAAIPLLATRLSERLGAPIRTAPQPAFTAALGAAVFGQEHPSPSAAASPVAAETPTQLAAAAPADMTQVMPNARIEEQGPLAWSEDGDEDDPVPYTGPEHSGQYVRDAMDFEDGDDAPPPVWYQRPAVVLSLVAAAVAILVAVILALTLGEESPRPVQTPTPTQPTAPSPEQTVTVTESNTPAPTTTQAPPPPPTTTTTTEAPVTTTTTEAPAPTTTYQPPPTTTAPPPTTTVPPPTVTERERPHWPWRRY